LNAQW